MGWLVPAHSVFFPTDSARPWRAASSADGLVTFSWELDTLSGKDAGCPMGPGNTGSGNVLEVWEQQGGGGVGESWDNGTGGGRWDPRGWRGHSASAHPPRSRSLEHCESAPAHSDRH